MGCCKVNAAARLVFLYVQIQELGSCTVPCIIAPTGYAVSAHLSTPAKTPPNSNLHNTRNGTPQCSRFADSDKLSFFQHKNDSGRQLPACGGFPAKLKFVKLIFFNRKWKNEITFTAFVDKKTGMSYNIMYYYE